MAAFKYKRRLWKMINAWVFSWWYSGACFDHCKHLKMELFAKTVNGLKHNGSEYMLFEKVRTSVFCFPFYIIHKGHWKKTSVEIEWNEFSNKLKFIESGISVRLKMFNLFTGNAPSYMETILLVYNGKMLENRPVVKCHF